MNNRHQVHNLIILDESGSMESIKSTIINGFNELVQTVKGIEKEFPEQEHLISLISFNSFGQKIHHFMDPVSKLQTIDSARYHPDASTPLFDAMGYSLSKLRLALEGKSDYNVLVTILTDGEENASKEYTGRIVQKMIDELKLNRWTFTYIGADHDVEKFAASLSITNTIRFQKSDEDISQMFVKEQSARSAYSSKIRANESTMDDFYENEKKVK